MFCDCACEFQKRRTPHGNKILRCPSCELYNAAVAAQKAAAAAIATAHEPRAKDAFLNAYGVMAWVDGVCMQVGTAEEAAPFAALTTAARKVKTFWEQPAELRKRAARSRRKVTAKKGRHAIRR